MIGLLPERKTKEVSIATIVVIAITGFSILVAGGIEALIVVSILVGLGYGVRALYRRLTRKSREEAEAEAACRLEVYNCLNFWIRDTDGTLKAVGEPLPPYANNIVE